MATTSSTGSCPTQYCPDATVRMLLTNSFAVVPLATIPRAPRRSTSVTADCWMEGAMTMRRTPAVTVPPTVTVPAGAISQTFEISTVNEPPTKTVTIVAGYAGTRLSTTLTVIAYPKIAGFTCPSTMPKGGTTMQCTATLATAAPPGGWQIALSTSDDSLASVPDTVAAPASAQTFQFEVATAPVTVNMYATIRIADAASGLILFSQAIAIVP